MRDRVVDVAVVGGGVAGVYTGWRLRTAGGNGGPKPSVTLFEGSSRIGGRLLSLTPPGMPHMRCELGGMRYESIHTLVAGIVERVLKLKTVPFPVGEDENLAYLRGVRMRLKGLATNPALPYQVAAAERGVDPGVLLAEFALDKILPGATKMKYDQLLEAVKTAKFDGRPLYEQGFWNVLRRVLSNEGYTFAADASGYDSLTSNWNTADAIPFLLADFATSVKYIQVVDGYDQVPQRLAERFEEAGGTLELGKTLGSFDRCILPDGQQGIELRFRTGGETIRARRLVLAMPRRSLELLEPTGPLFAPENRRVRALVQSVEPIPLFKLFLCYSHPWWEAAGVKKGRSVTDLPLRQCYYWGVEGDQPGANPRNRSAALLASYDDERYTTFWAGLRGHTHPRYAPRPHAHAEAHPGSQGWSEYRAPAPMVQEAHRELLELHGMEHAPEPYTAAYRDWQEDPYGGGVHFWRIGQKSWEVIPRMLHPQPEVPVYVCGEAYSQQQGWVEGALQTAELMLKHHFGLPEPEWAKPAAVPVPSPARVVPPPPA